MGIVASKRLENINVAGTTRKVTVREGETLRIRVPEGKLATFRWNGASEYEVVLADISGSVKKTVKS